MDATISGFLEYLAGEKGFSANTTAAYQNDLNQFVKWLGEAGKPQADLTAVQKMDIVNYILALKEKGYAEATVARKVASLKSFFHFLVSENRIPRDPTENLESPQVRKSLPRFLNVSQVESLLAQPARYDSPEAKRDKAMLELLYATGMRVTELVNLNIDDVNVAEAYVRCMGKGSKERLIPVHQTALDAIRAYVEGARPRLVRGGSEKALFVNHRGVRLTRQGFWLILKTYGEGANIGGQITPHTLRHSVATHLLRGGMPLRNVQELLGHASISTTEIYTHLADDHVREVFDTSHPRARA
jgi:integrase/recombinase XerD